MNSFHFHFPTKIECELCPIDYNYHSCEWNMTESRVIQSDIHYQYGYYLLEQKVPVLWEPVW